MGTTAKRLLFIALLLCFATAPYALNYMWFSDEEITSIGDRIKWWSGDTLAGPIRTNSQFAIMQNPVFYDYVIQLEDDFWRGTGYNPYFLMDEWIFRGAPDFSWPQDADWHREQAMAAGHYLSEGDSMRARVHLIGEWMRVWFAGLNQSFDSVYYNDYPIGDSAIYWIEAPLTLSGTLSTTLILCSGSWVGLEDNLLYTSSDPLTGRVIPGHGEKFALIAYGDIKVLNTWANGRENSSGDGNNQDDPDSTDIALNGLYYSLNGSFTFAQQNDVDSGYVCQCMPDDRGMIYLTGGVGQYQRGYVHRSTRASTGYLKNYRYDPDLKFWNTGLFAGVVENLIDPESLSFDTIGFGGHDTLAVSFINEFVPLRLTEIDATEPFHVDSSEQSEWWTHALRAVFAPPEPGVYDGVLTFRSDYYNQTFTVPLHGVAVGLAASDDPVTLPSQIALSAYPNPFNNQTTISFSLPQAGPVTLTLFDLLGRQVRTLVNSNYRAGDHNLSFNAAGLQSGLYFTNLQTAGQSLTTKLFLIR